MKAKKIKRLLGSWIFVLILVTTASALTNYDTFSGSAINYSKWENLDLAREIRNIGSGNKLFSRVSAFGNNQGNFLYVINPGGVYSLEAYTILLNAVAPYDAGNTTFSHAGLAGVFYNDGTAGSGSIGDVMAQVRLEMSGGQLRARYFVIRYTVADASNWVTLDSGTILQAISLNTRYRLSIKFDPTTKKFTLTAGTTSIDTPVMPGSVFNTPKVDWKALRTYVQAPSGYWGTVSAAFDNAVTLNASGVPVMSDPLSAASINSSNWKTNFEQIRAIENGHLALNLRRVDLTENNSNSLPLSLSEMINELQARVSLVSYQKSDPGFSLRARVGGYFFNATGNPASGALDEIFSSVFLGVEEGQNTPKAMFKVSQMTNAAGTTYNEIHSEDLLSPITLGAVYTVSIKWDGVRFTAVCSDGQGTTITRTFEPGLAVYPSNLKTKLVDVRLYPPAGATTNDSTIEATFDDIMTDLELLYLPLILKN
jgi:hypothetical protein